MIICVDFKQLPPATSRPPFIAADMHILEEFDFRMLRQNRRITSSDDPQRQKALENFHHILEDIAFSRFSEAVHNFFIEAYVRAADATAQTASFEGNTA